MLNRYSKYNAIKTIVDGISFASKAESELYLHLKLQGIKLECQPKVYLTKAKILFKPDFKDSKTNTYFEMKGKELATWRLKKKLWKHYGPGLLRIYKMERGHPTWVDSVTPVSPSCG